MATNTDTAEQKLVDLLGSAASYNDKGVEWSGHAPEKVAQMQVHFQEQQLALAQAIGVSRIGEALLSAIESGAASRDWSGEYAELAGKMLGVNRRGP